jgi:hypothetical protein
MIESIKSHGKISKLDWVILILMPMIFILAIFLYHPFRERFQYDTDEGLTLMYSRLVSDGYKMSGDVITDQPPLTENSSLDKKRVILPLSKITFG